MKTRPLLRGFRLVTAAVALAVCVVQQPCGAQASPDSKPLFSVHQVGIVRSWDIECSGFLSLPRFVHQRGWIMAQQWLDFSALYINPPQMTTGHQTFTVTQSTSGTIQNWYPHAKVAGAGTSLTWKDVQVGVMADGLETTHPVWMTPRAVSGAATLKVYKDGTAPAVPVEYDDPDTTEGEVYLFMRATVGTTVPLSVVEDRDAGEWLIAPQGEVAASDNTNHAWIVKRGDAGTFYARRLQLGAAGGKLAETRTTATLGEDDKLETLALQIQLNEALAGNGLLPDEAGALSGLVLQSVRGLASPALVYLVPQQWVDAHVPLEIKGPAEKPLRVFVGIASPTPAGTGNFRAR